MFYNWKIIQHNNTTNRQYLRKHLGILTGDTIIKLISKFEIVTTVLEND